VNTAVFKPTQPQARPRLRISDTLKNAVVRAECSAVIEVFGAPGTGKTSLLQARFESLVFDQGVAPEQILVLTATRESAAELRNRLLLGLAAESGVRAVEGSLARTVSSLAFSIVRGHSLANSLPQPELISGAEQDAIIARLLADNEESPKGEVWPSQVSKATRKLAGFRSELRELLATCQELAIDAGRLREIGEQTNRQEWVAAAEIFTDYEALLHQPEFQNRFDAPSLVNQAISLLQAGQAVEGYRAVLVDDSQELTPSAIRLLKHLVSNTRAGLFLVGDPDASTLGFRQADPRASAVLAAEVNEARGQSRSVYFLEERLVESGAVVVGPVEGGGAPPVFPVVARAMAKVSSLIGAEAAGAQRKVFATDAAAEVTASATPGPLEVCILPSDQAEVEWLAYEIRKQHLAGSVPWGEVAVVARTRGQLEDLERRLSAQGLPARILGAQKALRDEFASRELLNLANFVANESGATAVTPEQLLLSPFCGLDAVGLRRLRRQLRRLELEAVEDFALARNSDELIAELFANPASAETLRGREGRRVRSFLRTITKAKQVITDADGTIEDLLWVLWDGSGLAEEWSTMSRGIGEIAVQANRNLDAILALFSAANRYIERNPSAGITEFLNNQLGQAIPEDTLSLNRGAHNFVTLTTPAGLVGRRFHTVAIPGMLEGVWPNLKPRGSLLGSGALQALVTGRVTDAGAPVRTEMADELRMFYKAIGAANHRVLVSSFLHEDEQVSQFLNHAAAGSVVETKPFSSVDSSITLRGLAGSLRRTAATATDPAEVAAAVVDLARLAQAGVAGAHPDQWYGLLGPSTTEPLFQFVDGLPNTDDEHGDRINVRPSQLEAFVKCPLHWFLNYHGAGGNDFAASVGTLVHRAMELAEAVDEATLWRQVESGWHTLKFESAWIEQAERRRAQHLVSNLSKYLTEFAGSASTLMAREQTFEFDLGKAHIRGAVDRIEKLADGRVMIVDLKTSKRIPSQAESEKHAQLALYQLAYLNGAFAEVEGDIPSTGLAGAKLVLVSSPNTSERGQGSLAENGEVREYFESLVASAAEGMAMPDNIFVANVSSHCDNENEFGSCRIHLTQAVSYGE
jgi:superfamily I DNA/RNA helicase/RecB family exonuclease